MRRAEKVYKEIGEFDFVEEEIQKCKNRTLPSDRNRAFQINYGSSAKLRNDPGFL